MPRYVWRVRFMLLKRPRGLELNRGGGGAAAIQATDYRRDAQDSFFRSRQGPDDPWAVIRRGSCADVSLVSQVAR